ncbi:glutamine-hydrolyzing carbamoyl-phosphate synthase small subunit [Candidatus Peregrinibacteria bacterium]|nr:glutamine-hydrolyzing carbamoyl-phosphate synthase small subunit [Candidatus Peregrinibacteria bacterium]
MDKKQAKLILEDGSIFEGISFGAKIPESGEVVFNTGMVGYPETLTDSSYFGQILVLTYPLIGNYGVPENTHEKDKINKNFESEKIQIKGLIVSEYSGNYSHWYAKKSLNDWLKENNIPAITGIDTRALTQKLREKGTMLGKIIPENIDPVTINFYDPNKENIVSKVSIKKPITYKRGQKSIIIIDCGMKNNILRNFLKRNITVHRVPWNYDFFKNKLKFDAVFITNGPGDPCVIKETHALVKKSMEHKIPTLRICLGAQVLGIASGAKTYKLKYGHRSQNQPVTDLETGRCYITSQNHGFAIDKKTLLKDWKVWFENANDQTVEGIKHASLPFMAVQFHPESTPGPIDTNFIFDKFVEII